MSDNNFVSALGEGETGMTTEREPRESFNSTGGIFFLFLKIEKSISLSPFCFIETIFLTKISWRQINIHI